MCEAIGDTYTGLLEHSLKKSGPEDAVFVIEEAFKLLFEMANSKGPVEQRAASACILRVAKSSPSTHFSACSEFLVKNLIEVLGKKQTEAAQSCLESLLVLVLSSSKVIMNQLDEILGVLVLQIGNTQSGVRKVVLDSLISLCVVIPEEMKFYKEEVLEAISIVKADPDRRVKEAYQEAFQAVDSLPGEATESDITIESKMQKSHLNTAKSRIKDTSTFTGSTEAGRDDKKKGKVPPKREGSALNKKNLNPNFMKASSTEIEIFFNDKKPAIIPTQTHVEQAKPDNIKRQPPRSDRGLVSDRSHPGTDFVESRIENEVMTDPHSLGDTRMDPSGMGMDQPSHIPMRRGVDESNIFKDFENDRVLVHKGKHWQKGNQMDEERRRTPVNRGHFQDGMGEPEHYNRSRTPEGDYRHQMTDDRRRKYLTDEDHIIDKLVDKTTESIHQKIVKTNDYELKLIKKTCDGLKKENTAQLKIIEFQNKRIDSLVSHVQNMTLHINHLLGKVNQLEQNMFQISAARQQSPAQIIVPPYGYPMQGSTPGLDPSMHQQGGLGYPGQLGSLQQLHVQGGQGVYGQSPAGYHQQAGLQQSQTLGAQQAGGRFESGLLGSRSTGYGHAGLANLGQTGQAGHAEGWSSKQAAGGGSGRKQKAWETSEQGPQAKGRAGRWHAPAVEEDEDELIITDRVDNEMGRRDGATGGEGTASSNIGKKKGWGVERGEPKETSGNRTESIKLKTRDLKDLQYLDENRESANFMYAESTAQGAFDEERGSNLDNFPKGNINHEQMESEGLEEDDDEETNEADSHLKTVLLKDNRKILDYLADDSNLNQFGSFSASTVRRLVSKLAELLLCRIESYIEIVIPWLIASIESQSLTRTKARISVLNSLKTVLSSGKGSKTYKQELLQTLEALKRDLEKQ